MASLAQNFSVSKRRSPAAVKQGGKAAVASPAGSAKVALRVEQAPGAAGEGTGALWDLLRYDTEGKRSMTEAQRRVLDHIQVRRGSRVVGADFASKAGRRAHSRPPDADLTPIPVLCAARTQANYDIPAGFEHDREFGTHSGSSFEERLICAYQYGQLPLKEGATRRVLCSECGEEGHRNRDCAALLM